MVLPITPGQEPHADFSLTLQAAHRITGQIANLKPFSQPTLQLLSGDEDLGLNRSSLQPATGYFEIHDVLDGAYRLRVLGVGAANQPLVAEQEIRVSGGDVEDVALALGPGVTVKGSVRIDGPVVEDASQALQGFYLQLDAPEDIRALGVEDFESETEVDGAFQIPRVIPGAYRVRFEVLGSSSLYVSSARAGDQDLLATPELVLRNGLPPEIEIVLRSDGGSIEGMLASGIRDDEACLLLIPESLNRPTDATCTDDDGTFEFTAVAPGSYRLHAWNGLEEVESIEYNAPAVRAMLAAGGMRVEVRPSTKTEVQLRTLSKAPL
jgi:hypothetical protein